MEFYKSYLQSITQQNNLYKRLGEVDDSGIVKSRQARDTSKLESNAKFLKQIEQKDSIVNLSENDENNNPPETLLSKNFLDLMRGKYQQLEKDIKEHGGVNRALCSVVLTLWNLIGEENYCDMRVGWWKEDQDTLRRAVEFKALLQLLEDMNVDMKRKIPQFEIVYEDKGK